MKKSLNKINIILLVLFLICDSYISSQILASNPSFVEFIIVSVIISLPFIGILIFINMRINTMKD